ncbi:MAG: LPS biosynthesis glycosyltransferase [Leptolyngbya sp. DLM2.Bin27]|nr:MAG: LPS biosynthesis glycosyltransferase [Leptolyngbya sp. DLM2.Bin27]
MKFIDFFDRAYVLNLPERRDRREAMAKELQQVGLPFTPGKIEIFAAIKPNSPGPFCSIGTRGCFLSHLEMFKLARDAGLKNLLIMEDDLKFKADFCNYEEAVLQELNNQDWDLVQFGYYAAWSNPDDDLALPRLKPFAEEVIGTHFYAVNGKMIERLIAFYELLLSRPKDHPDVGPIPADGALNVIKWKYPDINRLIAVPTLGTQRSSRSDIMPKWYDDMPVLGKLANLARNSGFANVLKH